MTKSIILGGGCFWCIEAIFLQVRGIESVVSGYSGGDSSSPTYEQVCSGSTNHAEVVQLTFDDNVISLTEILDIFWHLHDPTTPNQQGADHGTQYRSVIFYQNDEEKQVIHDVLEKIKPDWPNPVITQIEPLELFYPAEDYHQNYFNKHPSQGYCNLVISPKLHKLREKYFDKLK
jgi:peptide-methionine (S)-S-oxide reductase